MSELTVTIFLIFIITTSMSTLLYMIYLEYARAKHLTYIKKMISHNNDKEIELLEAKKRVNKESMAHKVLMHVRLTGYELSIYTVSLIFIIFMTIFGALFTWFLQHWSGMIIAMPIGIFLFFSTLNGIIIRRKKEFNRSLAIAISVLVKMMKNGIGFEQAMQKSIDVSTSSILKGIFSRFFQEKNTIGELEAFANMDTYINSKELRIFALAVKIGRASGGRFSTTLEKVEQTIQYRKKMQDKVDVVTREGAIGSYVVAGIAVFLYFALDGNFDGKLHTYFMNSEYGRFQLLAIFLWVAIGLMINKFITKVDT